ncbi:hypothetical protein PAPYR_1504 [Paratrimastix pyriformis]|uniref:Uncharacterized protein n=1 Tax=Paratrimastix pyriformis TaxID=342808 RepID=A0ABQ8URS5_9EUKA|nr:hypothetical protein PAPYR_1504 [Paratrimastix pyriformis]
MWAKAHHEGRVGLTGVLLGLAGLCWMICSVCKGSQFFEDEDGVMVCMDCGTQVKRMVIAKIDREGDAVNASMIRIRTSDSDSERQIFIPPGGFIDHHVLSHIEYCSSFQQLLQAQLLALIQQKGFTLRVEEGVRRVWDAYLSALQSDTIRGVQPSLSLAIVYVGCLLARQPVLLEDLVWWALSGQLPLLRFHEELVGSLASRRLFTVRAQIRVEQVQGDVGRLATLMPFPLPPPNGPALALRLARTIALPASLYPLVMGLLPLLQVRGFETYYANPTPHLVACLVAAMHLAWTLDTDRPECVCPRMAGLPPWATYFQTLVALPSPLEAGLRFPENPAELPLLGGGAAEAAFVRCAGGHLGRDLEAQTTTALTALRAESLSAPAQSPAISKSPGDEVGIRLLCVFVPVPMLMRSALVCCMCALTGLLRLPGNLSSHSLPPREIPDQTRAHEAPSAPVHPPPPSFPSQAPTSPAPASATAPTQPYFIPGPPSATATVSRLFRGCAAAVAQQQRAPSPLSQPFAQSFLSQPLAQRPLKDEDGAPMQPESDGTDPLLPTTSAFSFDAQVVFDEAARKLAEEEEERALAAPSPLGPSKPLLPLSSPAPSDPEHPDSQPPLAGNTGPAPPDQLPAQPPLPPPLQYEIWEARQEPYKRRGEQPTLRKGAVPRRGSAPRDADGEDGLGDADPGDGSVRPLGRVLPPEVAVLARAPLAPSSALPARPPSPLHKSALLAPPSEDQPASSATPVPPSPSTPSSPSPLVATEAPAAPAPESAPPVVFVAPPLCMYAALEPSAEGGPPADRWWPIAAAAADQGDSAATPQQTSGRPGGRVPLLLSAACDAVVRVCMGEWANSFEILNYVSRLESALQARSLRPWPHGPHWRMAVQPPIQAAQRQALAATLLQSAAGIVTAPAPTGPKSTRPTEMLL